jgi:N-acetylmuramoyl-L-alanine amidase
MELHLGITHPNVRIWKKFLEGQGHRGMSDNDVFGEGTHKATKNFQLDMGLRTDGRVGSMTVAEAKRKGFAGFPEVTEAPIPPPAQPIKEPIVVDDKLVLVSAGHTNDPKSDRGADGNGFIEGDEAVTLRDHVAAMLRSFGVSVIEDGIDGKNDPLSKALVLARRADIAVEFHWNASHNKEATGIECLAKPKNRVMAQKLASAIAAATGLRLRGGDGGFKRDDSGQHHRLAFCEAGGLILEVCFISNADDMDRYTKNFQAVVANLAQVLAN